MSRKRKLSVSITSPPVPVMLPDRGCNMITVPYINVVATGQNIDRMRIAAGFP